MDCAFFEDCRENLYAAGFSKYQYLLSERGVETLLLEGARRVCGVLGYRIQFYISAYRRIFHNGLWHQSAASDAEIQRVVEQQLYKVRLRTYLEDRPELLKICNDILGSWARSSVLMLRRFALDVRLLKKALHPSGRPSKIEAIEWHGLETHRLGSSVAIFTFSSGGRIVYKPRPVRCDLAWAALVESFNGIIREEISFAPLIVDRGRYGWTEFVPNLPCKAKKDVETFYSRMGNLLSLCLLLGSRDVVRSNVIAKGDLPVLIDAETALYPLINSTRKGRGYDELNEIHSVGLLPKAASLIGGGHTSTSAVSVTTFTPAERLSVDNYPYGTKVVTKLSPSFGNAPHWRGERIPILGYEGALLEGFQNGCDVLLRNRKHLCRPESPVRAFKDAYGIFVLRPTVVYGNVQKKFFQSLSVASAPLDLALLLDDIPFLIELRDREKSLVRELEAQALASGDVPKFSIKFNSRVIRPSGLKIRVGEKSGLERALSRIENFDEHQAAAYSRAVGKILSGTQHIASLLVKTRGDG